MAETESYVTVTVLTASLHHNAGTGTDVSSQQSGGKRETIAVYQFPQIMPRTK